MAIVSTHTLDAVNGTHAGGIPIHPEAHAHLIAAVKLMTGGRCPSADSLGWSNWVIRASA